MRWTIPLAIIGIVALAGCASAGGPTETSAPAPETESSAPATPTPTDAATPSPSSTPGGPEAPQRITDDAILGSYDALEIPGDEPLVVWADDSHTLVHVIGSGSGTESCQPTGESIEVDDGRLDIDFSWDASGGMQACTADLRVFGWAFPVAGADASITQAVVDEWTEDADDIVVDIRPATGER